MNMPILADIARERGCDLRFDSELADFTQDDDDVSAAVTDVAIGQSATSTA
jgi:FAD binding domain